MTPGVLAPRCAAILAGRQQAAKKAKEAVDSDEEREELRKAEEKGKRSQHP
jgi:hypothetical protein